MTILVESVDIHALLRRTRSVAIVGMSADPSRPSHGVGAYLDRHTDWTVWYVNPNEHEILGQLAYPSLADLPAVPDLVDVFRRRDHLPGVVEDSIDVGAAAVWFQLGLVHDDAAARASAAGIEVVQNRCLEVVHSRLTDRPPDPLTD